MHRHKKRLKCIISLCNSLDPALISGHVLPAKRHHWDPSQYDQHPARIHQIAHLHPVDGAADLLLCRLRPARRLLPGRRQYRHLGRQAPHGRRRVQEALRQLQAGGGPAGPGHHQRGLRQRRPGRGHAQCAGQAGSLRRLARPAGRQAVGQADRRRDRQDPGLLQRRLGQVRQGPVPPGSRPRRHHRGPV